MIKIKVFGVLSLFTCLSVFAGYEDTINSTDMNSTQIRNPETHSASSGSGSGSTGKRKYQGDHYDHQDDQEAPEGLVLGSCQVCFGDVTDKDMVQNKALACFQNHFVDTHCLAHQVRSLEINILDQARDLKNHGLYCCGDGARCKERIALATIEALLEAEDRNALHSRLDKIEKSALDARAEREINALSYGIEGAFNLCCPAKGCGAILDKVEGCNAAKCSACNTSFCYLCLEPQVNPQAAHAHASEHSNNFWEMRPGFTGRYHWQVTRKKLKEVLKGVSPKERQKALETRKDLLEEKYFWPMPVGITTAAWIKAVQETPESSRKYYVYENHGKDRIEKTEKLHTKEKKIEILQNEYIFLSHEGDKEKAELVKLALQNMGAQVFASLDVQDAGQPVQPFVGNERLHPVLGDEQVQAFRALGAEQYRVDDLIWSSAVHEAGRVKKMSWYNADAFCRNLVDGARLPTADDYDDLTEAMGWPNYNPDMIADMRDNTFWLLPVRIGHPDYLNRSAYFHGSTGDIDELLNKREEEAVRCVRAR